MDGTSLATASDNVYASYGARVGNQGTFLTFKNGEFLAGQDGTELALDTKLIANMAGFRIGWRRWWDDQITDDLTELLVDQLPMKQRNELGDMDQALWKKDNNGKPFDPWQLTNILDFADQEGEVYIYATGSKGGIGALGRLCKEYGKQYRQHPGMLPIIQLNRDHYMHKEFGKTYFPVFNLVDWVDEGEVGGGGAEVEEAGVAPAPPPPAPAAPAAASRKARF